MSHKQAPQQAKVTDRRALKRRAPGPKLLGMTDPVQTTVRRDITGTVRFRSRKSHRGGSSIRLQVETSDVGTIWITWPEDAPPARPGDTITATVTLTTGDRGPRATRLSNPRRIGRLHEQLG